MGARFEPAQLLAPQRSYAHMCPLGAIPTPAVAPHVLPSGSLKKFSTVRYGFGWELGWARTSPPDMAITAIANRSGIAAPPYYLSLRVSSAPHPSQDTDAI